MFFAPLVRGVTITSLVLLALLPHAFVVQARSPSEFTPSEQKSPFYEPAFSAEPKPEETTAPTLPWAYPQQVSLLSSFEAVKDEEVDETVVHDFECRACLQDPRNDVAQGDFVTCGTTCGQQTPDRYCTRCIATWMVEQCGVPLHRKAKNACKTCSKITQLPVLNLGWKALSFSNSPFAFEPNAHETQLKCMMLTQEESPRYTSAGPYDQSLRIFYMSLRKKLIDLNVDNFILAYNKFAALKALGETQGWVSQENQHIINFINQQFDDCILELEPQEAKVIVTQTMPMQRFRSISIPLYVQSRLRPSEWVTQEKIPLLVLAVRSENVDMVEYLLQEDDVDVMSISSKGVSLIQEAIRVKSMPIIKALMNHPSFRPSAQRVNSLLRQAYVHGGEAFGFEMKKILHEKVLH